jgi:endoglucanase
MTLVAFLRVNGNRQAILSETGGGNTASCMTKYMILPHARVRRFCLHFFLSLDQELAYVKANSDILVGFTVWAAGSFDTNYVLSVTPNLDGTNQLLWNQAGKSQY